MRFIIELYIVRTKITPKNLPNGFSPSKKPDLVNQISHAEKEWRRF
jgi:hypothetical protein